MRARLPREAALRLACPDKAPRLAVFVDSRFSARETARERDFDVFFAVDFFLPALLSCWAFLLREAGPFGACSFTPARLALDSPIAIACFGERAPCLPSRTWWISSLTNSPACVEGDFPSRASSFARSMVSRSGRTHLQFSIQTAITDRQSADHCRSASRWG
jgi:hypothetical protein